MNKKAALSSTEDKDLKDLFDVKSSSLCIKDIGKETFLVFNGMPPKGGCLSLTVPLNSVIAVYEEVLKGNRVCVILLLEEALYSVFDGFPDFKCELIKSPTCCCKVYFEFGWSVTDDLIDIFFQ